MKRNGFSKAARLCLLAPLAASSIGQVFASTVATGQSGYISLAGPAGTKTGSSSWFATNPTVYDNINWSSGPDYADGQVFYHTIAPETKFTFTGVSPGPVVIGPATYKGFTTKDCSTGVTSAGSCSTTSGSGSSTVGIFDTATWTVKAGGTLGTGIGASYYSTASGDDPWTLNTSDFAGMSGQYSLFFTFGLSSASFSAGGSVDMSASYGTASGTLDLLDLVMNSSGVQVSTPDATNVSIFQVPMAGADPSTLSASALTNSQLESLFEGNLSGNSLTSPIVLGFLLNDLSIPTTDMGGGVVAQVDEVVTANDEASGTGTTTTPEPSSLSITLCGAICVAFSRIARRRHA